MWWIEQQKCSWDSAIFSRYRIAVKSNWYSAINHWKEKFWYKYMVLKIIKEINDLSTDQQWAIIKFS